MAEKNCSPGHLCRFSFAVKVMVNLPLRLFDHWIVLFDENETKCLKVNSVVGHIRHASLCDYEVIVISDLTSSSQWSHKNLTKLLSNQSKLEQNSRAWLVIISPIWALTGQRRHHACVIRHYVSNARTVVHFTELFLMKTYNRWLVSFSNFVIVLIN